VTSAGPRLNLLVLYTRDIQACRDFYEAIGLSFVREQHESGPEHFSASLADGCVLELYPVRGTDPTHPLRIGLTIPREAARDLRLLAGTRPLRDPEGRVVDVAVA
jgi:catechol 2,3-dioxygenase-like lactoylglutathione lyase family enzyme